MATAEKTETLIYALRPDKTSLWLPMYLMQAFGLKRGQMLTQAQMHSREVQELLEERHKKTGKGGDL